MNYGTQIHFLIVLGTNLGRAFQSHSRSTTSADMLTYAGIGLAVVGLLVALVIWDRQRKLKIVETDTELILFRRLCRLHALGAADTNLLSRLAKSQSLGLRSAVFVDPSILDRIANAGGKDAERFAHLRRALFGDVAEIHA